VPELYHPPRQLAELACENPPALLGVLRRWPMIVTVAGNTGEVPPVVAVERQ
jgi:hypothetical protein